MDRRKGSSRPLEHAAPDASVRVDSPVTAVPEPSARRAGGDPAVVRVIARLNIGGPAVHVLSLCRGLDVDYPTLLIAGDVDEGEVSAADTPEWADVQIHWLSELGRRIRPWQDAVAFVKLVRMLRKVRPRIVHTHTAKAGTLGRIAAIVAGVPIRVHTFHGHVFRGYFGPLFTKLVIAIERILARGTTCIIAISARQADELVHDFRICSPRQLAVVPLGLDLCKFSRIAREADRGDEFRREIGCEGAAVVTIVGRLVPIKNHALFLDAAARVFATGRQCVFVVVGGGPEELRLLTRAKELGIEGQVRFLGWRTDIDRIYAGSDVIALTSDNEGTPVSVIEALAAGRAVVATSVGGVEDVLENGRLGLLVPPRDSQSLARSIELLLDRPDLRRQFERLGADVAPRKFGVARLLHDIRALYATLEGRAGAAGSGILQAKDTA